ncbi:hypothetical protein Taro_049621 [Colocasia esculenta]|uniref:MSP domain-containing protein n=1 Tax=Colocasia esculenta TaxID=4460 RepID=A0A843XBI3_COLES|nr:hypothetical protein [Colocasia esculenta]
MNSGNLLSVQPSELKFPFELKKQSSCSMQLTNKTDQYVAFKVFIASTAELIYFLVYWDGGVENGVKTTNPKKYCVRPNTGVVLPGTTCDITGDPMVAVTKLLCRFVFLGFLDFCIHFSVDFLSETLVTMQAQKEAPPDFQCKDKFLIQSVITESATMAKDINSEMFNKAPGKSVDEFKMRVVYIPANPPSPVPEEPEEGLSPRSTMLENGSQMSFASDALSRSFEDPFKDNDSEASSVVSKLTEEKTYAIQQNQKLWQEMELLRKESRSEGGGFSVMVVVLVGLLGVLVGYLIKKT